VSQVHLVQGPSKPAPLEPRHHIPLLHIAGLIEVLDEDINSSVHGFLHQVDEQMAGSAKRSWVFNKKYPAFLEIR
jgi:hypothetical protein